MHRLSLCRRFCCQPRLRWVSYSTLSRRVSTVPVANTEKQAIESLKRWQDSSAKALARREEEIKDIIVDDLSATLEAHRASNRAAVIRKIKPPASDLASPVSRPLFGKLDDEGSKGSKGTKTHEPKDYESHQTWPADSVQAQKIYGKTGSKGFVKKTDPLEYTGVAQWPKLWWKISHGSDDKLLQRPWLAYMDITNEGYLERLKNEIKAYEAYMRLSSQEEAASQLVISDVNAVARNEPEIKPLTLLGSRSTGLATPTSDFDFTFTLPTFLPGGWIIPSSEAGAGHDSRSDAVKALKKLDRHFRSSNKFTNANFVRHAHVPIIRSTHIATGLHVQIQTMAPYLAAQQYTVAYLSEYPSLRPLYIILRYCLEVRNLTTVFEGGLGSYSILMMIVTAMKHSSGKFASDDLVGHLLHVLEFYGKADLYKVGFSANPARVFEKQKERWTLEERMARTTDSQLSGIDKMQKVSPRKPYLLCLQDPANDSNDLGKNAYAIKHIQATFSKARESIQVALDHQNKNADERAKDGIWSCLDSLVRADYTMFEMRRNKIERCARPRQLGDEDYSNERLREEFQKRANRYKGVTEEEDDLSVPALEAIDEDAAPSNEAKFGSSDGTRLTWSRKGLERLQAREKTSRADKGGKSQRLYGTNDDEYGWVPSSLSDQRNLLEVIAVPKSALAARPSAPKRLLHSRMQKEDENIQTVRMPSVHKSSTRERHPNSDAPPQMKAQEHEASSPPINTKHSPESFSLHREHGPGLRSFSKHASMPMKTVSIMQNLDEDTQTTESPTPDVSFTKRQQPDPKASVQTHIPEEERPPPKSAAKSPESTSLYLERKRKTRAQLIRKHTSGLIRKKTSGLIRKQAVGLMEGLIKKYSVEDTKRKYNEATTSIAGGEASRQPPDASASAVMRKVSSTVVMKVYPKKSRIVRKVDPKSGIVRKVDPKKSGMRGTTKPS